MLTKRITRWSLLTCFCGVACVVEPEEEAFEQEITEEELADPFVDEDEFRANSYSCLLEPEEEEEEEEEEEDFDIYCLVKCEDYKLARAVINPVDPRSRPSYWCEYKAKEFCDKFDAEYDYWCWGIKD